MDTNPLRKRLKVFTLCLIASVKCSYDVFAFVSGTRVESRRPHPHPPDRLARTAAGRLGRTARKLVVSSYLVSSPNRFTTAPDPNPPLARAEEEIEMELEAGVGAPSPARYLLGAAIMMAGGVLPLGR